MITSEQLSRLHGAARGAPPLLCRATEDARQRVNNESVTPREAIDWLATEAR